MHPAPGNASGTLVNGILHHCNLPNVEFKEDALSDTEDSDDEFNSFCSQGSSCEGLHPRLSVASIRPGIVHRLDKGTSGLLVVAKVFLIFSQNLSQVPNFNKEWKFFSHFKRLTFSFVLRICMP